jgi:RNA-directed DNA polymerase
MSTDNRQKTMTFATSGTGNAPGAGVEGVEVRAGVGARESLADTETLMEEICERENCLQALKRVKANKGAPGIDGMTVEKLPAYLKHHWPEIRRQLLAGRFKPSPVRRHPIEKPGGGVRLLGIPTVLDRFIQQVVAQALSRHWDPTFSDHSFGFRPKRSQKQAVVCAQEHIRAGHRVVVDIDVAKFFDTVNHDRLMQRIGERVTDRRVLTLVRSFLRAGVLEDGLVSATEEGTPQGGPLSPLLSNLVLDELDEELEQRGHRFVRYADDTNVYVRSRRAGERVMQSLTAFITQRLKLKINLEKSAVDRPSARKFLGFSFTGGSEPRRRIAPSSILRFKERVRELTGRSCGRSMGQIVTRLAEYLVGWRGYYGFCETRSVLKGLDQWLRRRLRAVVWTHWKGTYRKFTALIARGVERNLALQTVRSGHGTWRIANSPALNAALSLAYFDALGLPQVSALASA